MADAHSPVFDFSAAGLIIAAHGSPSTPGGKTSTRRHAETIRKLGLFADVQEAFLTEKPFAKDVLDSMETPEIFIVPNLACAGFISTNKLPKALGLTGPVTERIGPSGHQRVFLCDPVGSDPGIVKIVAGRIAQGMTEMGVPVDGTEIVMIGHGSQKSSASFHCTINLIESLSEQGMDMPLTSAFLEEPPFIESWRELTDAKTVVFVPYLISDGYHGADEIPRDIGFNPKDEGFQERLKQGQPNETEIEGRRLIYLPPIGDAPEMAQLVLNQARAAQVENA